MARRHSFLQQSIRFIRFYARAKTIYDLHSPLAFTFAQHVLEDRRTFYAFPEIETLRSRLLQDTQKIQVTDLGAGSQFKLSTERSIQDLVRQAATLPVFCRYLFYLVNWRKPACMLELGTSLAISSLYQAAANTGGTLHTIEGCPATADQARKNIRLLKAKNIQLHVGAFSEVLPTLLPEIGRIDYLFLDGHHQKAATLAYFEQCLPFAHTDSVFVLDDIHWSGEMEAAWQAVKAHPRVSLTIDLFAMGVVFFQKEVRQPRHYQLVPARWKPWRLGFFN